MNLFAKLQVMKFSSKRKGENNRSFTPPFKVLRSDDIASAPGESYVFQKMEALQPYESYVFQKTEALSPYESYVFQKTEAL